MLVDRQVKICYVDQDFPPSWEGDKEARNEAKLADIIICRDGKVVKDRFAGYNFKN